MRVRDEGVPNFEYMNLYSINYKYMMRFVVELNFFTYVIVV